MTARTRSRLGTNFVRGRHDDRTGSRLTSGGSEQRKLIPNPIRSRVGVGMTITNHPLHRSGRALLTHPAPALGDDAKSSQRIRVMDSRRRQPAVNQTAHSFPLQPRFLAAPPQRAIPVTGHVKAKRGQRLLVRGNPVVAVVSLNHRPEPFTYFRHRLMPALAPARSFRWPSPSST